MIRFLKWSADISDTNNSLIISPDIWEQGRKLFLEHLEIKQAAVTDKSGHILCAAYRDDIANQELRMLKEIISCDNALHFEAMYPDCECVIIDGCNELAYYTAKYIKSRGIPVVLRGKYWKHFDIESAYCDDEHENIMTVYAEGTDNIPNIGKTVSVEFDCIYKLYMENVKLGKIKKTSRTAEELLSHIKEKRIYLLFGHEMMIKIYDAFNEVNDLYNTYDYLLGHGIKIEGIIIDSSNHSLCSNWKGIIGVQNIITFDKAVSIPEITIVNCYSKNSLLGGGRLDEYIYNGFVRDESYIFIKDYIDVPKTGLANTIKNKTLFLAGDKYLCNMMRRYFIRNGIPESDITDIGIYGGEVYSKELIGVILVPKFFEAYYRERDEWKQKLKDNGIMCWTDYFSDHQNLVYLDICENKRINPNYMPRGIIFGNTNGTSGNIFRRDCIDNHPEILQAGYSELKNMLFWYCLRLAEVPKAEIPNTYAELSKNEMDPFYEEVIPCEGVFLSVLAEHLDKIEGQPSPYELFVIFYIAINKCKGRVVEDISKYYLYWDPNAPERYVDVVWLSKGGFKVCIIDGMRNVISQAGSGIKYIGIGSSVCNIVNPAVWSVIPRSLETIKSENWENIFQRFEDIKLDPQKSWGELCEKLGIEWSDTFLETTRWGKEHSYTLVKNSVVTGYDLKPVYNTYPEFMSPFDAFRIQMASMEFQSEFGYPYDDCLRFSRKQLQDMFLMRYKAEDYREFENDEELRKYNIYKQENIKRIIIRGLYNKLYYESLYSDAEYEIKK